MRMTELPLTRKGEQMTRAKEGDTVKVHYTGRLDDNTVFDTSHGKSPLEFTIGEGNLIKGFENGLIGMEVGEKKNITVSPNDAYGWRDEKLSTKINRSHLPNAVDPKVGMQLKVKQKDGRTFVVWIADLDEETVTLDANHPLAGKTLCFDLELTHIA
jgi:FKBP-type peptidyl-prolyl cis-trans isomerase 2